MKDFLFAEKGLFGKDLFAINIQRGRDHGLRSYNDYRAFFGMAKASSFSELNDIPADLRAKLSTIYAHVDDIDVYVGGLAENHVEDGHICHVFEVLSDEALEVDLHWCYVGRNYFPHSVLGLRSILAQILRFSCGGDLFEVSLAYSS